MPKKSSSSSSSNSSSSEDSVKFTTVVVQKLSPNVSEDHLKEIFGYFGAIQSSGIRQNPKCRNYGLVNYSRKEDAELAISIMHNGQIDGMHISAVIDTGNKDDQEKSKSKSRSKSRSRDKLRQGNRREKNKRGSSNRRDRNRRTKRAKSNSFSSSAMSSSGSSNSSS